MEREIEFSVRYLSYAGVSRSFETLISICLSLGLGVRAPRPVEEVSHRTLHTSETEH